VPAFSQFLTPLNSDVLLAARNRLLIQLLIVAAVRLERSLLCYARKDLA